MGVIAYSPLLTSIGRKVLICGALCLRAGASATCVCCRETLLALCGASCPLRAESAAGVVCVRPAAAPDAVPSGVCGLGNALQRAPPQLPRALRRNAGNTPPAPVAHSCPPLHNPHPPGPPLRPYPHLLAPPSPLPSNPPLFNSRVLYVNVQASTLLPSSHPAYSLVLLQRQEASAACPILSLLPRPFCPFLFCLVFSHLRKTSLASCCLA